MLRYESRSDAVCRVYVIPLFGAYIADTRWGRYKTVCVSVVITLIGHVLLIICAIPGIIERTKGALACFIVALIIKGLGYVCLIPTLCSCSNNFCALSELAVSSPTSRPW